MPSPPAQSPTSTFPSQRDRIAHYAQTTFGPPTLLVQPFLAAFTYATDPVPEWGHGASGYGKQLGFTMLNTVSQNTIEYGVAAALGEDNTYYRCKCTGFWRRTGHAFASPLVARNNAGHKRPSIGYIIGAFTDRAGAPDRGKFTLALRRDHSGQWLIVSDMDNGNSR